MIDYDELAKHISLVQPVSVTELETSSSDDPGSESVIMKAASEALNDVNRFYPLKFYRYVTTPTYTLGNDEEFLMAYGERTSGIPDYGISIAAEVVEGEIILEAVPAYLCLAKILTDQNIDSYPEQYAAFRKLCEIYAKLLVSNLRRKVSIDGLGMDIKGDSFYSEAKEELDSYLTKLVSNNTSF